LGKLFENIYYKKIIVCKFWFAIATAAEAQLMKDRSKNQEIFNIEI
jgi:hypothetical protein